MTTFEILVGKDTKYFINIYRYERYKDLPKPTQNIVFTAPLECDDTQITIILKRIGFWGKYQEYVGEFLSKNERWILDLS